MEECEEESETPLALCDRLAPGGGPGGGGGNGMPGAHPLCLVEEESLEWPAVFAEGGVTIPVAETARLAAGGRTSTSMTSVRTLLGCVDCLSLAVIEDGPKI